MVKGRHLRLRADFPEAHYNYAILLDKRVRWEEAEEHYPEALRLRPDDPDYYSAVERVTQRR